VTKTIIGRARYAGEGWVGRPHRSPGLLKLVTSWTLAVLLSSCSDRTSEAEDAVRASLTDPGSAQFRNVEQKGDYFCGEVNSKNKHGGYDGFRHFYIGGRGKDTVMIDPRSWATPASQEVFGDLISPFNDTPAFEAVYFRVCA